MNNSFKETIWLDGREESARRRRKVGQCYRCSVPSVRPSVCLPYSIMNVSQPPELSVATVELFVRTGPIPSPRRSVSLSERWNVYSEVAETNPECV